jgi:hypothetical protein
LYLDLLHVMELLSELAALLSGFGL